MDLSIGRTLGNYSLLESSPLNAESQKTKQQIIQRTSPEPPVHGDYEVEPETTAKIGGSEKVEKDKAHLYPFRPVPLGHTHTLPRDAMEPCFMGFYSAASAGTANVKPGTISSLGLLFTTQP